MLGRVTNAPTDPVAAELQKMRESIEGLAARGGELGKSREEVQKLKG